MEASVKERLTGALIFVAATVIIVPEMFSGPEPASTAVVAAQPAETGPPMRTISMTLDDSADPRTTTAPVPVVEAPVEAPAPASASAPAPSPQPAAEARAEAAPVAAVAAPRNVQPAVIAAGEGSPWWLRVGIFGVRDNAERLARKLRTAGFAVDVDKQVIAGKDMYRVRAGPVRDRAEALALQARLKDAGDDSILLAP